MLRRQPEVPRWRRSRVQPVQVVTLSGRQARKLAREAVAPQAVQAPPAHRGTPGSHLLRASGAFRFRLHLMPVAWLALLLAAGLGIRAAGTAHPLLASLAAGTILGGAITILSLPLSRFARRSCACAGVLTTALVPLLTASGWTAPVPPAVITCWLLVATPWWHRHRWRPPDAPDPVSSDASLWAQYMAAKRARDTWLTGRKDLPQGGRQWTVMLPAGELAPASIMSLHPLIAGVWDKPMTEVFPEPYPDGRQSRCLLTILERDTLAAVAEWDGTGVDPATGCASLGRFADGQRARVRLLVHRDGIRHGLVAGTTGAGKTYILDLLIRIALSAGFVPVVLDPQEGQSLPHWRDVVPYASGVTECMAMLRGLHAGMLDRSAYLAGLRWSDHGHEVRGMDFYDRDLCGLPPVLVIADEMPVLLTDSTYGRDAVWLAADIAKRGRKTGVAEWPVAQVPSLSELGDQVVRSMLRGGNVICLRTGDSVSAGYLGLQADPSALPAYFADGTPTAGLGYLLGPDQRQAPFRADLVPARLRHAPAAVPALDDRFAAAMQRAMNGAAPFPQRVPLAAAPDPDEAAPEGRTAADAILAALTKEMDRGQIIKAAGGHAIAQGWRQRPYSVRAVSTALAALTSERRVQQVRHGTYAPVRASLTVVGANASDGTDEGTG